MVGCFRRLLLPVVIAAAVLAAPTSAAAATEAVVWSGGTGTWEELHGALLSSDGTLTPLTGPASGRAAGKVVTGKPISPSAGKLATLRKAAGGLSGAPPFTSSAIQDGVYSSAVVKDGSARFASIGVGAAPAKLGALIAAVNAALPVADRLAVPPTAGGARAAREDNPPDVAPCPTGPATTITKDVPLKTAAGAGIVTLRSKGTFAGDAVGVDATWKLVKAPVRVTVNIEVIEEKDAPEFLKAVPTLEAGLSGAVAKGPLAGTPVTWTINARSRSETATPTPCYHQIRISSDKDLRSYVTEVGPSPRAGEWSSRDPEAFRHEIGHLAGLPDRYRDVFVVGGKTIPLPAVGLAGKALADALAKSGVSPKQGYMLSVPKPGAANDLMAVVSKKLAQADLARFATNADLNITAAPGDVLLNKNSSAQNLATAGDFSLIVPKGKSASVEGLVAYCLDQFRTLPSSVQRFDVLGAAAERSDPSYQALAAVMKVITDRMPAPLSETPGGQEAVWRITDNRPATSPEGRSILAAAGVPPDATFAAPHYTDPNHDSAETGAVTESAVVPATPELTEPPAPALRVRSIRLDGSAVSPAGRGGRTLLPLSVDVEGGPASVTLQLERRSGKRFRRVASFAALPVDDGFSAFTLAVSRLAAGGYRVRVVKPAAGSSATFSIRP